MISENAARDAWPGQSAIGERVKWGNVGSDGPWFTVVGLAATTRYRELAAPRASLYLPAAQFVDGATSLAVHPSLPLASIAGPLRDRVRELDRNVFVPRTKSFDDYVARPLARPRPLAVPANIFAAVALLLATAAAMPDPGHFRPGRRTDRVE